MIRAGTLRYFVTIKEPGEKTASGDATGNWKEFGKVWANIEPLRGRELQQARAVYSTVTTTVTIRYIAGLTTRMRIETGGRVLKIQDIIDVGYRGRKLELMCEEIQ